MIMWPGTRGSFGSVSSPSNMCRSVRPTAQAETSISTWPCSGTGSGSSRSASGSRGRSRTIALTSVGLHDLVQRGSLGRRTARPAGGVDQLLGLEPHPVPGPRHPGDVLLHQGPTQVVDAPAQALGGRLEAHLHPARLQVGDRPPKGETEGGRVLEVVRPGDLLHPVSPAEQGVVRDEAERHELGDPAGALLEAADDPHVTSKLTW